MADCTPNDEVVTIIKLLEEVVTGFSVQPSVLHREEVRKRLFGKQHKSNRGCNRKVLPVLIDHATLAHH